jgi:co-chaperonin GroES (HSP10)
MAKGLDLSEANLFLAPEDELQKAVTNPHFFRAINYNIIVALPMIETHSRGGILLADESKDFANIGLNFGRIVSLGETVGEGKGGALRESSDHVIGQWVQFRPHVGYPLQQFGAKFLILRDEDIIAVLSHPQFNSDPIFKTYRIKGLSYE